MKVLLFVGGPNDGQRVSLQGEPNRKIRIAVLPNLPRHTTSPDTDMTVDFESFSYSVQQIPSPQDRGYWVAYPVEWDKDIATSPMERITTALVHGYVGRA